MADDPTIRRLARAQLQAKDGSLVSELAHPSFSDARHLSLAEATVPVGGETVAHRHRRAEEIYSFTAGTGRMALGGSTFEVGAGDSVVIAPGTPHKLWNTGSEPLVLLCACAPPYAEEDTELLE